MLSTQRRLLLLWVASLAGCSIASQNGAASLDCLEGRSYYHLEDGYSCRINAPGRPRVESWKGKIEILEGRLTVWGDVCNDAPIHVETDQGDLTVADDCLSLSFMGNRYLHMEVPPETPVLKGETQ